MIKDHISTWDFVKVFLIAIIFAFALRAFFFEPTLVRGISMQPALQDMDRLLISKMAEPKRFDIIVFHADASHDYVKRVIGLPGDEVEYRQDTLYINGEAYNEPYLEESKAAIEDGGPLTNNFKLEDTAVGNETVPETQYFVLGDNRRDSVDSRYIGTVSRDDIVGVSKLIFFPFGEMQLMNSNQYRHETTSPE